jgi:hypothetical protein
MGVLLRKSAVLVDSADDIAGCFAARNVSSDFILFFFLKLDLRFATMVTFLADTAAVGQCV